MDAAEHSYPTGGGYGFFSRKFTKAMEKSVNNDNIGVRTINSGG
jgi:hypothetical protein